MAFITRIYTFFNRFEHKQFMLYMYIVMGALAVLIGLSIFQYYRSINFLHRAIKTMNKEREKTQHILTRAQEVDRQKEEVNSLLMQEPDFKIGGYFKKLLASLNMLQKEKMETTQTVERDDNYIEHTLNAQFVDMHMKDLAILLEKIENNPRIYTRELEIKRSEKTPGTIDVTLVIATLLPTTNTV